MLHKAQHLKDYTLKSRDGEIGTFKEFYCDDQHWAIRYLVADTGNWLTDRQVLIPPSAISAVNTQKQIIDINLTKQQIVDSPFLTGGKSGSREFEDAWDPYLRSSQNVIGSHVQGTDGELGHVDDFLIDVETWAIRYFIIDTRKWWLEKKVLISSKWIERVSWLEAKVYINLARETMKQAPEYMDLEPLTREYEANLHTRYQRWESWLKPMFRIVCKSENGEFLEFKKVFVV